jgi:hypothetical protein
MALFPFTSSYLKVADGHGTVLLMYNSRRPIFNGYPIGSDVDIVCYYSIDNGLNWTQGGVLNILWAMDDLNTTGGGPQDDAANQLAVTMIGSNVVFLATFVSRWNISGKGIDQGTPSQ